MIGGVDEIWCQVHSPPHCTVSFRLELGTVDELRFPKEISEAIYVFDTTWSPGEPMEQLLGWISTMVVSSSSIQHTLIE